MAHDGYLTTTDVAQLLKLSDGTVQKMAREGRISALKMGRLWRFPPQSPGILLYKQEQKHTRKRKSEASEKLANTRNGLKEFVKLAADIGLIETPIPSPSPKSEIWGQGGSGETHDER